MKTRIYAAPAVKELNRNCLLNVWKLLGQRSQLWHKATRVVTAKLIHD